MSVVDHVALAVELSRRMNHEHFAVNPLLNPVAVAFAGGGWGIADTQWVVDQYRLFPAAIVAFLAAARLRARRQGWERTDRELTRNIGEELGTETEGETHYALLMRGLREGAGAEIGPGIAHPATTTFLDAVYAVVSSSDPVEALGGAYALECSAVPELRIVRQLAESLMLGFRGEAGLPPALKYFFDLHIGTWEPGHELGLRLAMAEPVADAVAGDRYTLGFERVISAMDVWWTELARARTIVR